MGLRPSRGSKKKKKRNAGRCEGILEETRKLTSCFDVFSVYCNVTKNKHYTTTTVSIIKVQVYSLVSSAKRHLPDFTQLPPWSQDLFIRHLNSLRSIQPSCHSQHTELFKYTSLHCPTRYPLTPGSRECMCGQSALPRSTTSEHI